MNGVEGITSTFSHQVPELDDAATVNCGSDANPATVVEVVLFKSGPRTGEVRKVAVQYDDWTVVSGGEHDGSAAYRYSRNRGERVAWFTADRHGRFSNGYLSLVLGERRRYFDPHF